MTARLRWLARGALDLLLLELRLYRALLSWLLRRRPGVRPGVTPIGYARMSTPVMALWILASAMEVPLVHVLTPWEGVRLTLLALGIWGVVWMLGMLASTRVHPHLLSDEELVIQYGAFTRVPLQRADVAGAEVLEQDWPGIRSVVWSEDGEELAVPVSSRTNVRLELAGPVTVRPRHAGRVVTRVSLWVDEPREVARLLRPARQSR